MIGVMAVMVADHKGLSFGKVHAEITHGLTVIEP